MQGSRQDYHEESREDWQQHADQAREDRQDFAEDQYHGGHWDYHYGSNDVAAAFVVGTAVGVTAGAVAASSRPAQVVTVTTLPCTAATVIVNGTTFYQCGTTWYSRGYQGNNIVYIVATPPPGH
ncbi:MAG: hypothetical protein GX751_04420 [Desulfuromonadaceae bacterium]|nr:hypothetical protein [Desulfuromonadaceae bacterium]